MNLQEGYISYQDVRTPLTPKEFDLLRYLVARYPDVVPKAEILTEVWGYAATIQSRAVHHAVTRLRRKLGPAGERLVTIWGRGLKLELPERSIFVLLHSSTNARGELEGVVWCCDESAMVIGRAASWSQLTEQAQTPILADRIARIESYTPNQPPAFLSLRHLSRLSRMALLVVRQQFDLTLIPMPNARPAVWFSAIGAERTLTPLQQPSRVGPALEVLLGEPDAPEMQLFLFAGDDAHQRSRSMVMERLPQSLPNNTLMTNPSSGE
ncbi:MAG: winged helix-turn-helix domain-containing protein [Myxococcota bacterium]